MGAVIKACSGCGGATSTKKKLRPIVISGPSGGGKSTLVNRLIKQHEDCFAFSISHTTRAPRAGETDGKEYHFVSLKEMMKMVEEDEFIEHTKFAGNLYGTSKQALEDVANADRICVLDLDLVGVKSLKRYGLKALYICIIAPSIEVLKERLRKRGTEDDKAIALRILSAIAATEYAEIPGSYDHVIINDDADRAYAELESILERDIEEARRRQKSNSTIESQSKSESTSGNQPKSDDSISGNQLKSDDSTSGNQPKSDSTSGNQPQSDSTSGNQPKSDDSTSGNQPKSDSTSGNQPQSDSTSGNQPKSDSTSGNQPKSDDSTSGNQPKSDSTS